MPVPRGREEFDCNSRSTAEEAWNVKRTLPPPGGEIGHSPPGSTFLLTTVARGFSDIDNHFFDRSKRWPSRCAEQPRADG